MIDTLFLYNSYGYLLALSLAASVAVVALAYMAGKALSDEKLEAFAKSELSQIFFSVVIVLLFFFAIEGTNMGADKYARIIGNFSNVQIPGTTPGNVCSNYAEPCQVSLAQAYLESMFGKEKDMAAKLIYLNSKFLLLSDLTLGLRVTVTPWGDMGIKPFGALGTLTEGLNFAIDLLYKLMVVTRMQQYFIDLAWQGIFPIFLVLGFLLRNFFATRKIGGLFLAIAAAVYFAFPFMYALSGYILYNATGHTNDPRLFDPVNTDFVNPFGNSGDTEKMPGVTDIFDVNGNPINPTSIDFGFNDNSVKTPQERFQDYSGLIGGIWEAINGIFLQAPRAMMALFENDRKSAWYLGEGGIFDFIAKMMLFTVFMPFIALMATLSTVKVLSPLLGGDVEIAGLTRLI